MPWVIVHYSRILYRGSFRRCTDAAADQGLTLRVIGSVADLDRGIDRGPVIMPAGMVPERYRRRAA